MRWEYVFATCRTEAPDEVKQRLDTLGRAGWEAIGLTQGADGEHVTVLLKRRFRPHRQSESAPR